MMAPGSRHCWCPSGPGSSMSWTVPCIDKQLGHVRADMVAAQLHPAITSAWRFCSSIAADR